MSRWVVDLPFHGGHPSLNQRLHWAAKARLVAEWRETTAWAVKAARVPSCDRVRLLLVVTPPDRRQRDVVNLALCHKACEDGVVDAGVVPDDTPAYVEALMPVFTEPGGAWAYRIVITELSQESGEALGGAA